MLNNRALLRYKFWCFLLSFFFLIMSAGAQVQITANHTALALAQKLTGHGVIVTNATLNCAGGANGIFTVTNSNIGLDSGVVLSTGLVLNINESEPGVTSTNNNRSGDPDLVTLSGANSTRDACILEFDMIPQGDQVKFDYVFASEEYINAVCGPYNDAFAFFISGPGITGTQNMALVPNTNIAVTVNSINNGIPGSQSNGTLFNCTQMGAGSPFTQYYINNQGGATIAYRGFTTLLTAQHAVSPCETYHLKIAIADAQNALYDSGVFLKAGSLKSPSLNVITQSYVANTNASPFAAKGCGAGTIIFSREQALPTPQVVHYAVAGTAVSGTDYAPLSLSATIPANGLSVTVPVNALATAPPGTRVLKVMVYTPVNCNNTPQIADSANILIVDPPMVEITTNDTSICAGKTVALKVNGGNGLQYIWTPNVGVNNDTLREPQMTVSSTTQFIVTATLPNSGCIPAKDSITISTIVGPESVNAGDSLFTCTNYPIAFNPEILPNSAQFDYTWSGPRNYQSQEKNAALPNPKPNQTGWYRITATIPGCDAQSDSVFVTIVDQTPTPEVPSPIIYCVNEEKPLEAWGRNLRWYLSENNSSGLDTMPNVNTEIEGVQYFWVSQWYGDCESNKAKIEVHTVKCCTGIFNIPNAFTPNADGLNDVFSLQLDADTKVEAFYIFNRWGQRIYTQTNGNPAWNGYYNGRVADVGTYFFLVNFKCKDGKTYQEKGSISLLR